MSKGKWSTPLSAEDRELVDALILEQKLPVVEIRKRTRASLPYVYRRFRHLGVQLPIERAGLYSPLTQWDKDFLRKYSTYSVDWLAKHLNKRKNLIRGFLIDLQVEALFKQSGPSIKEIAQVLGLSQSRVRLALANLGYRLEWVSPSNNSEERKDSGDDGE